MSESTAGLFFRRIAACFRSIALRLGARLTETAMNVEQRDELWQQMHETELGGVKVYEAALTCVLNEDLKEEWEKYLAQTKRHVEIVQELMTALGVRPLETPGRLVVWHIGVSLVGAIKLAKRTAPPEAAEIVACESIVHAETKDHANWELLTTYGQAVKGQDEMPIAEADCFDDRKFLVWSDEKKAIDGATDEIEDEEDEHLYHSKGWCRELAIASLGLKAVLPPPEEQKDVKTAIGAARAKQARTELI